MRYGFHIIITCINIDWKIILCTLSAIASLRNEALTHVYLYFVTKPHILAMGYANGLVVELSVRGPGFKSWIHPSSDVIYTANIVIDWCSYFIEQHPSIHHEPPWWFSGRVSNTSNIWGHYIFVKKPCSDAKYAALYIQEDQY